ncbi:MAG: c-type cytochrome [Burkholderiales bacterium]
MPARTALSKDPEVPMFRALCPIVFLLCILAPSQAFSSDATQAQRGRMLYEGRCVQCHSESVHGRRSAKSYEEVRHWVRRWDNNLGNFWRDKEIEEVTTYLNNEYYQYPCTGPAC